MTYISLHFPPNKAPHTGEGGVIFYGIILPNDVIVALKTFVLT